MAVVCQECGTSYEPNSESPGCPKCAAAQASEAAPAKAAPPPRVLPKSTVPKSTIPKGQVAASGKTPAAGKPAPPRSAAPPARPAAQGQAPAAGKPAQRVAAPSRPAAKAAPSSARPAPHRSAPHRSAPEGSEHVHHAGGEQPILDDATRYGLFATLGFGLVVAIVCFFVFRAKAERKRERDAFEAEVAQVYKDLQGLDVNDPGSAERIIKLAAEKESKWMQHDLAADIESLVSRARANLTVSKEKGAALARFAEIEAELQKSDLTSERLKELRRQLDESEARMADGGAELVARFGLARTRADQQYATRLADEARTSAQGGATPRASLVRYQGVEDEIKTLLDRTFTSKNKEQQDFYTPLYKQVIGESDALANSLFQAEGESLAWVDCLAPPQEGYWNASSARGFSHKVENGALLLIGPDPDAGKMAVISIGDREQWRHFQADIEFVMEKGDIDLFLRLGRGPNQNTLSYPLRTSKDSLVPGKKYSARVSVIGSKFNVRFAGEDLDTPAPFEETVGWTINRKGAIGFVVSPEARAKFTRLRVRELR